MLNYIKALKCRECGKDYPPIKIHVCEACFGPLDVVYNLAAIELDKNSFKKRSSSLWRYKKLLPINDEANIVDLGAGFTILYKCK
jgi:threonine synthase